MKRKHGKRVERSEAKNELKKCLSEIQDLIVLISRVLDKEGVV